MGRGVELAREREKEGRTGGVGWFFVNGKGGGGGQWSVRQAN